MVRVKLCVSIALACLPIVCLGSLPGNAFASTPRLNRIVPRGAQRGHEHQISFRGERLGSTKQVLFHDSGMTATKIQVVNDKLVKVTIKIDADCRAGEHFIQLRTKYGISDFRSFHVGVLPSVADTEPNNNFANAQPIQQDVTVDGLITAGDVDLFSFEAVEGQRLSVEIQAIRLGFFFDPLIELYDSNEQLLIRADDSPLGRQDGFFSIMVAKTGKYFVKVRDTEFGGTGQSNYRLHIGSFIRPSVVFPSGGKIGDKTKLILIGDQRDDFKTD